MIGKGKSISHGTAALEYDLAKEIDGQTAAIEIARHELYGCTGAEMVQEMKPYHADFPNVKNNCLRFEVSPSIEESATFTDADWAELGNDFMQRMGLANHQYIIIRHSGTAVSYTHLQGFDLTKFKEELGRRGFKVREARASTGKLNGYYVTARSGTEYKAVSYTHLPKR